MKITLHRSEQRAPTEPGRYYAVRKDNPNSEIFPVYLGDYGGHILMVAGTTLFPLEDYRWFGPVPEVQEIKP